MGIIFIFLDFFFIFSLTKRNFWELFFLFFLGFLSKSRFTFALLWFKRGCDLVFTSKDSRERNRGLGLKRYFENVLNNSSKLMFLLGKMLFYFV